MGSDHGLRGVDFAQYIPCCHIYLLDLNVQHPLKVTTLLLFCSESDKLVKL